MTAAHRRSYVSLKVVKSNYGPSDDVFWFRRHSFDEVGLLEHVHLVPPPPTSNAAAVLRASIVSMVRTLPGAYSRTALRDKHSGKAGTLMASKASVENAVDILLKDGDLVQRAPTATERKAHRLTGQVKAVLDVPP